MNTRENDPGPLERQLQARLTNTTPEFEARFDDLCRRLADEPARRRWWAVSLPVAGLSLAGAAIAIAVVFVARTHFSRSEAVPPGELATYSELLELEAALRDALVLVDPETRESLLSMPVDEHVKS